jgi:hypothetical protein
MATAKKETTRKVRTLPEMRALAAEQGLEQIAELDDPRLADFWEKVHKTAENSAYCGTFDQIITRMGGVPRPRKDYFTIKRQVEVTINGETKTVTAEVRAYGPVGDEEAAIKSHYSTFGRAFKSDIRNAAEVAALALVAKAIKVTDSEFKATPRKPKTTNNNPIAAA